MRGAAEPASATLESRGMKILGIQDGHSASAALLEDGVVVAAVQEERLTRRKNEGGYPAHAIEDVLRVAEVSLAEIDRVAFCGFSATGLHSREAVLEDYGRLFERRDGHSKGLERGLRRIRRALLPGTSGARRERRRLERRRGRMRPLLEAGLGEERVHFVEHHRCHAATAYFGQGDIGRETLVLTCDAAGDGLCAAVWRGEGGRLHKLAEIPARDSVALLYSLVTYLLGFVPLEHEYKLMGMAPYAEGASGAEKIRARLRALVRADERAPTWQRAPEIASMFRVGPALEEMLRFARFDHVCAGLQAFVEEFFVDWTRRAVRSTGLSRLGAAGGLFMNVKLNQKILALPEVESLFVFPSCGDETNSIGAAWSVWADACLERGGTPQVAPLRSVYWGADLCEDEIKRALDEHRFQKRVRVTQREDVEERCAELLACGEVVARCKGRMEFGARALGNRSILAHPGSWPTIHTINRMIKQRDFWMPFAPSILAEHADRYLENPKGARAPFMILTFPSRAETAGEIVGATHPYDGTCRPQLVEEADNPDYHRLIRCFFERTGVPAVLNTSFNLHGFPVVYRASEALDVFDRSGLRYLALGDRLVEEIRP